MIPFNKPYAPEDTFKHLRAAIEAGKISGNGKYTQLCHEYFQNVYRLKKCLLTTSATDALEMCALLANIQSGDEVIMPTYTFVSTANAFVLRGAKVIFADSRPDHPGMDEEAAVKLITDRTRAIVPVHYAGVSCNMDVIMDAVKGKEILVIEDAAHSVDSFYVNQTGTRVPLGSIGHLAAFSFHETKNITSGEGGMLVINDERFERRAEIIWEKGTNRAAFWRGEVDKYGWVDIGSSFLPSELIAAFLWAQLENLNNIQTQRIKIWQTYYEGLKFWAIQNGVKLPFIPGYATNNAHMFYMVCPTPEFRTKLIDCLKKKNIFAVFHYQSLHKSAYYGSKYTGASLPNADRYSNCLVRLPLFYELTQDEQLYIIDQINRF